MPDGRSTRFRPRRPPTRTSRRRSWCRPGPFRRRRRWPSTRPRSGAVSAIPGGERLTFGGGSADLNPATDAAHPRRSSTAAPPFNTTTFTVTAYAAGIGGGPVDAAAAVAGRAHGRAQRADRRGRRLGPHLRRALGAAAPTMADGPARPGRHRCVAHRAGAAVDPAPLRRPPPSPAPAPAPLAPRPPRRRRRGRR